MESWGKVEFPNETIDGWMEDEHSKKTLKDPVHIFSKNEMAPLTVGNGTLKNKK